MPLLEISWRGVRVDQAKRKQAIADYKAKEEGSLALFKTQVGKDLNPHSPAQLQAWLYAERGIKPIMRSRKAKNGEKSETASVDETAIRDLLTRHNIPALSTLLDIRETHKILETYLSAPLDKDGRLRTSYDLTGTETGRLSSRATPFGTGTNPQNVPKGIAREMVVPDEGMTFVGADLSQAEARVVAYLAKETRLIEVFTNGGDIHRRNAARIFRKPEGDITTEERYLAKRVVHASNYGMGPNKFAQVAGIPKARAIELLNAYFTNFPRIKVWHLEIQEELRKSRTLTTPLGRVRQFMGAWNDDLLREAYAYIPQATVSDILNDGLVETYELLKQDSLGEILLQVHDSILVQCKPENVETVKLLLKDKLARAIPIAGATCLIPVTISHGESWNALKES
jgi:DNA polymerase-1